MSWKTQKMLKQAENYADKKLAVLKEKHPEIKAWCITERGFMLKTEYRLEEINGELFIHYDEYNHDPYPRKDNIFIHRVDKVIKFADTLEELENETKTN